jgi:AraC-like DNA-binding protein
VYSPIRYCVLRIVPDVMERAAHELGIERVHFPNVLVGNQLLYTAFSRFYRSLAQPSTLLEQQTRLSTFLRYLLTEASEEHPDDDGSAGSPRSMARVREYLEAHLADPVCLDDLAKVAGLSRFHLSRTFAQAYGLSPHAYHNQLRLRAIRERLRGGLRPDSIDAGFFDQSHMIRHFRDSMGMTPGEFAAAQPTLPRLD